MQPNLNLNSYYSCRTAKFKIIPDLNTPSHNKVEKLSFRYIELDKYKNKLEDNNTQLVNLIKIMIIYFMGKNFVGI